jgi:phosphate transport system protein
MVFKELLSFWHDQSALTHIFANFDDMLKTSKTMFDLATEALLSGKDNLEQSKRRLIKMDSRLNTLQQVIRRDIVTHIAVQGTTDIVPCLVMMSVTKDAERTGDYAKNILEVAEHCEGILKDPLFNELKAMRDQIAAWYTKTRSAIQKNDGALARSVRGEAYDHEKKCDKLIWQLAEDNGGRNAVAPALMLRFFKRISAHLGNILTMVVMPFDKIDYHDNED